MLSQAERPHGDRYRCGVVRSIGFSQLFPPIIIGTAMVGDDTVDKALKKVELKAVKQSARRSRPLTTDLPNLSSAATLRYAAHAAWALSTALRPDER